MDHSHWLGPRAAGREWLRGAIGGLIGIGLAAWLSHRLLGMDPALPWLIAPMGATAVLVFEVPASPFSRPWPVLAGHIVSAAIGYALHLWLGADAVSIALAVGLSIAAMSLGRCLHPPAGGTALLMAVGSPAIERTGWGFLAAPIALNVLLLLALALVYHRLTGHSYPHHGIPTPDPEREIAAIDQVLEEWDEVLDISSEDLAALIRAVDARKRAA